MHETGHASEHLISIRDDQIVVSRSDAQGQIVFANADFIELSGYSEEELLGRPHNIVRHPDMPGAVFADLWRDLKAGRPWIGMIKNRCKNGDAYWVEAHVSPIWENGRIVGYMSMRRKASPAQIARATQDYAAMRADARTALSFRHGVLTRGRRIEWLRGKYDNAGLTTKLILTSVLAAIIILGAVTYFLAKHVTRTLNDNAGQQLRHDVSLLRAAVAARIESANLEVVEYSRTLSKRVYEGMGGEKKASLAALEAMLGQDAASRNNPIDLFLRDLRGVGTIFVLTPDGFQRRLTSAVDQNGQSAVGSFLATDHPANALLLTGKSYVGVARVFGHQYLTSYSPIFNAAGKVIGASVIGIDMADQLATLKSQMRSMKVGDSGYYYIVDATPGPYFGTMILHPYREGQVVDALENNGHSLFEKMARQGQGEIYYDWKNIEAGETSERRKLVMFETLNDPHWVIAGGSSADEFTALSRHIIWLVVAGWLVMSVTIFLITLLLLRKLVLRPLNRQVLPTFQAMSDGRFDTPLDLRSNDEIGRVLLGLESLRNRLAFENERERTLSVLREKARHEAEHLSRARAEFLANMSHEIRTPLNAVIGLAYLLLQGKLGQREMEYVKRIEGAGKLLLAIINDILDFSKIDAGRMQLEDAPFRLDDVLDNLSNLVRNRVQEKGLVLEYVVSPETPQSLRGDALRLSQILINLVSNAIKFTAEGSITVHIDAEPSVDGRVELFFRIADTGIGMSEEQLGNLFRAFSQADSSVTRKFGGSGLGLVICKRLIEMMGGTIGVDSQPKCGSTFGFTVWLGLESTQTLLPPKAGYRVLVVDDNELARKVLEQLLLKNGCSVQTVNSGEDALIELRSPAGMLFDCVMVDLNMPDMDGVALAHHIRHERRKATKLVMVTGENIHVARYRHALEDFDSVIEKPVTAARLNEVLVELQGSANGTEDLPAVAKAPLAGLRILVAEDVPTNQLIMRDLLESLGATVEMADNGIIVLESLASFGNNIDLILMDIQMPEMDGLEASRRIRSGKARNDIPIIALTAHALDEERKRAIDSGMNDFLTKPIEPEQLLEVIQLWRPTTAAPASSAPPPEQKKIATEGADLSKLRGIDVEEGLQRMLKRQALFEKILRDFESRFSGETSRIRAALAAGDSILAARQAHSVKGTGGMISARELASRAAALEQAIIANSPTTADCLDHFDKALEDVLGGIRAVFGSARPS